MFSGLSQAVTSTSSFGGSAMGRSLHEHNACGLLRVCDGVPGGDVAAAGRADQDIRPRDRLPR
jgi:hypothetical protein